MKSGADTNPVTGRPVGMNDPDLAKTDAYEIDRLKNQLMIDAAFRTEAGEALIRVVTTVVEKRIQAFLEKDVEGQVCLDLLKVMNQHRNAAANAAKKLVTKYGGVV